MGAPIFDDMMLATASFSRERNCSQHRLNTIIVHILWLLSELNEMTNIIKWFLSLFFFKFMYQFTAFWFR